MKEPVIESVSKYEIMCAKNIGSRTTFNNHIKKSGIIMPDFWYKQRVFVGKQVLVLEQIFNVSLIKNRQTN
jgi:hypothetical protein